MKEENHFLLAHVFRLLHTRDLYLGVYLWALNKWGIEPVHISCLFLREKNQFQAIEEKKSIKCRFCKLTKLPKNYTKNIFPEKRECLKTTLTIPWPLLVATEVAQDDTYSANHVLRPSRDGQTRKIEKGKNRVDILTRRTKELRRRRGERASNNMFTDHGWSQSVSQPASQ